MNGALGDSLTQMNRAGTAALYLTNVLMTAAMFVGFIYACYRIYRAVAQRYNIWYLFNNKPFRVQRLIPDDFPSDFSVRGVGVGPALAIADLPPASIAAYFRQHPDVADRLLSESYDKRYSPVSYIMEQDSRFHVGWYSSGYSHVHVFSNLADAATDYLLLTLGKGRWTEPGTSVELK